MSLIAKRPKNWGEVIGQEQAVELLHGLLRFPRFMTRGFILEGPYAVGKTSSAYMFARALMCEGDDPLGCGTCASCMTADASMANDESLNAHPSFMEIDAAYFSGVGPARELLERLDGPAALGKRRVILIDEAQRLSEAAYDIFLKPLEMNDSSVIFLFATSDGEKIPKTIASRCTTLRFTKVGNEALTGRLMAVADQEDISYTLGGLRAVAKLSDGHPRDAVKMLGLVAALGLVSQENVERALNLNAGESARTIFLELSRANLENAIHQADLLAQRIGPVKVIETLFSYYKNALFAHDTITAKFAPFRDMAQFFLKWSVSRHLPSDIIPLFVLDLSEMRADVFRNPVVERVIPQLEKAAPECGPPESKERPMTKKDFREIAEMFSL
jgi:DNA polymerase-3 subunit gamma/tau